MQLGLEVAHDRFGLGVAERVSDGPDRGGDPELAFAAARPA